MNNFSSICSMIVGAGKTFTARPIEQNEAYANIDGTSTTILIVDNFAFHFDNNNKLVYLANLLKADTSKSTKTLIAEKGGTPIIG